MKNIIKPLLIVLTVIIVLIGVVFVAVAVLFPPEKVKSLIITELSKKMNTEITLEKAGVNIFTGIELGNLIIKDPKGFVSKFPAEPLLSVESARVDVNLLDMIFGKLSVNGVTVTKPSIKMEKNVEGETNMGMLAAASSPAKATNTDKKSGSMNEMLTGFNIKKIDLKNAYFHNIDNKLGNENKISDINAVIVGFGIKKDMEAIISLLVNNQLPIKIDTHLILDIDNGSLAVNNLVINIPNSTISGSGNVDFKDKLVITMNLATDRLDLNALANASQSGTPKAKEKLKVDIPPDVTANISFNAKQIASKDNTIDNLVTIIKMANQGLAIDMRASIKGTPVTAIINGDFRDRFYPRLNIKATLSELKITIKEKDPNSPEAKISNTDIDKATKDIPPNIAVKINLTVTKLDIGNLIAQNNVIDMVFDKKIVNLSVTNDVYGGKFKMSGIFDTNVSGLGYNISSLTANNVDGAGLLHDFSMTFMPKSMRGLIADLLDSGKANLNLTAKGSGIGSETLMQNLVSNITFTSDNAVLKENKMLASVAPLVQNSKLAGKIQLNLLNAKISTSGGVAKVNINIDSRDANLKMVFVGDVDLVNKAYKDNKLSVWVNGSPVEFRLTGAIDKPVPVSLAMEQKGQQMQNQAQQQIDTQKSKAQNQIDTQKNQVQQDVQKKGQDMLNNILKK